MMNKARLLISSNIVDLLAPSHSFRERLQAIAPTTINIINTAHKETKKIGFTSSTNFAALL